MHQSHQSIPFLLLIVLYILICFCMCISDEKNPLNVSFSFDGDSLKVLPSSKVLLSWEFKRPVFQPLNWKIIFTIKTFSSFMKWFWMWNEKRHPTFAHLLFLIEWTDSLLSRFVKMYIAYCIYEISIHYTPACI